MNFSHASSLTTFSDLILTWFDVHGRKTLPWQAHKTPYRVWISEIMLQQTQVKTVIPYFSTFMQRFPTLASLATAPLDDVLHCWAGLGYYSRARNLHKAAQLIHYNYDGQFPQTVEQLQTLPGVGRSTAGAIASIAFNHASPILDGNVKRVLSRVHGISDPIDDKKIETQLWSLASHHTPQHRPGDYTQAIMDIGATVCTRTKPICRACPLATHCVAYTHDSTHLIPRKKSKPALPERAATFLIYQHDHLILLQQRPSPGIWGGLWCLPEISGLPDPEKIALFCQETLGSDLIDCTLLPSFRHTFTHYHLQIHPVVVQAKKLSLKKIETNQMIWYNLKDPKKVGLPKPIQTLLSNR